MPRLFNMCVNRGDSLYGISGPFNVYSRVNFWRSVGLRTQTGMALDPRSARMDVCDLPAHSHKNDLGAQTCPSLCTFDCLRLHRDEYYLHHWFTARHAVRDSPDNNRPRTPD